MSRYFTINQCMNGWIVRKDDWGSIGESRISSVHVFKDMAGVADHILDQSGLLKTKAPAKKRKKH